MAQAQLNGTLIDDGGLVCSCYFEYGVGAFTETTAAQNCRTGDTFHQIVFNLLGGTTYQFRAVAANAAGTSYGSTLYFTTPVAMAIVLATAATNVLVASAVLNCTLVDDGGEPCKMRFQYGTTVGYGMETDWDYPHSTGATLAEAIVELASGMVFHFRAQAQNGRGIVSSPDITFATLNADEHPCIGIDPALMQLIA